MKQTAAGPCFIAAWLLALASLGSARADNWPQWRGPDGDGICRETGLPISWSKTSNVAWTVALPGMGGSTPAVWGERLFLTSQDGRDLVLLCLSTDGKQLWKRKLGTGTGRYRRDEGNDASSSPSTDGKHVYAMVGTGDLVCFDAEGKEIWRIDLQKKYGRFEIWHGMHTTPLLHGDRLYLQLLHSGAALVLALDKITGKEVWKVTRKSDGTDECEQAYASPVLWRKGKEEYLVIHGCDYTTAHRLDNGAEIWRLGGLNPKNRYNRYLRFVASPVASADLIVVPTAKNGPVVGVKPTASGLILPGDKQEQWRLPRNTPDVPSPLIHDGLVYLCRENGVLLCLDAKSGQEYYSQRLHASRYRASPVYADGKIYLTARDGTFTVVRAGRKCEVLASNRLPDEFTASPAVSGGKIYLRGFKTLYAIGPARK
jgi:outer membrane protein assembly factor BamB